MRRLFVVFTGLLLVAACGGQNATTIVSSSATKARDKGGARMEMTFVFSGGGQGGASFRSTSTGSGAFDFERRRGSLTMKVAGTPGGPGTSIQTVMDRSIVYMKCPGATSGAQWIRFDAAKLSGVDPNSFGSDPSTTLDYVKSVSGDVEEVGKERVRGTETTHYRFTASVDRMLERVKPEARERQRQSFRQMGVSSIPVDVWIDDEGLPRKMVMKMESIRGTNGGSFEMTMEMFDYGKPVNVSLPSAAQAVELSENASPQTQAAFAQCFGGPSS